jgi:hypothetical protein
LVVDAAMTLIARTNLDRGFRAILAAAKPGHK